MKQFLVSLVALAFIVVVGAPSAVAFLWLRDGASDLYVYSDYNTNDWFVDGEDQLYLQGFWVRWGSAAQEYDLGRYHTLTSGGVPGGTPSHGSFEYELNSGSPTGPNVWIETDFSLVDAVAGDGKSSVNEVITIHNRGVDSVELDFFQYVDFNLGGTPGGDVAEFVDGHTVDQLDSGGPNPTWRFSETTITSGHWPDLHQGESDNYDILTNLNNLNIDNLTNTAIGVPWGPGNVNWAFQWHFNIGADQTVAFCKNKNLEIIPEPATLLLLGLGLVGAAIIARRRRNKSA